MSITGRFQEGLAHKQLLLPWCNSCGKCHFYPRTACPHCWSKDYDWRPAAGTGVVHSFTIVRSNPPTTFAAMVPYAIAIVALDEGVRLLTNLVGDFEAVKIGDRVQVEFAERGGAYLPLFRRVE
jgi:uncharacterized OB-fold protein